MNQVGTHGVSPTHMTPAVAEGVELEEKMILAFEIDQTVRIVGPVSGRRKVELGTKGFVVGGALTEEPRAYDHTGETDRACDRREADHFVAVTVTLPSKCPLFPWE